MDTQLANKIFQNFQVRTEPCNIHRKTDYDTVGESLVILICFQVSHRKESTNVNKENVALHKISTHKGNRTNKLSRNTKYIYIYATTMSIVRSNGHGSTWQCCIYINYHR